MPAGFEAFYENRNYRRFKPYLFNYRLRKRKIGRFLKHPRGPVLDIGCGIAPMAPDRVRALLGDKSFAAMKWMNENGHRPVVLDITRMGLQSNSVSTIICSEVLEHIDDDQLALREIFRVLKPGGDLILTVPMHRHYWRRDDEIVGHYRRYESGSLLRDLKTNGFHVVATAKVGSVCERYLTLATVLLFLKTEKISSQRGQVFIWFFDVANRVLARLLEAASFFSPRILNSVGLFYCRKLNLAEPTPRSR